MKEVDNHSFNVTVATVIGHEKAILLKEIYGWVKQNWDNQKNIHNGLAWTYNSAKAYAAKFPYFSDRSISRWLNELEQSGYIASANYNEHKYDKTKWYTVNTEAYVGLCSNCDKDWLNATLNEFKKFFTKLADSISQNGEGSAKMANEISQNGEPIPSLTFSEPSSLVKELVESHNSTVVVHDQVDGIGLQVHDVIDDNAALLPQLDVDEGKEKIPKKRKGSAAAKNPDPTPINAMWEIILEQSAKIGIDEPQFMPRYARDFKLLYAILKQRAEKRQEPITDQVEPFRRYVNKIVDYIIKGRNSPQHQFTANNLARNFNPGYLHNSFNQICATISGGVSGVIVAGKQQPAVYNEQEVYSNYDASKAAF